MKLADVCAVEKQVHDGSPLPYVGLEDIESSTGRYLGDFEPKTVQSNSFRFTPEHLLYGRLRPYLNKLITPEFTGHCSTEIFPIRPSEQLDRKFLFYWLSMQQTVDQIDGTCTGARMPRANMNEVMDFEFLAPSLPEQKRIVAILDEAFAGIAAATANAEKNLANARELFTSSLNSTFRNIPVGWTTTTLGEVCDFQGGSQPPKSVFMKVSKDDSVRLIQIRDYKSDNHIVYIPKGMARRFCNASDVMIGRYGPPLFQILRGIEGAYNVALMKAVPNTKHITKDFLYYFLKNGDILKYIIDASSRAAGQIGLNKETLEPYPISFPSIEAQGHLVSKLISLESDTRSLVIIYEQKLQRLAELKQAILQQAFSGELAALPDAEMQEEAA